MPLKTTIVRFLFKHRGVLKRLLPFRKPLAITLDGFKLYVRLDDWAVGARIAVKRTYEPLVTRTIQQFLHEGTVFVDVGANIGYYTMMAAARVGSTGKVIAFEPNPANCQLIQQSTALNAFRTIDLHPYAVSDRRGTAGFNDDDSNGRVTREQDETPKYKVETVDLDTFLATEPRIDVLKMDIEGFEGRALQGMKVLLRQHMPIIISEFNAGSMERISGVKPEAYLDQLRELGYTIAVITDRLPQTMENGAIFAYLQQRHGMDHIDLLLQPRG